MYSVLQYIRTTVGTANDNEFYDSSTPCVYLSELHTLLVSRQLLCPLLICCATGYGPRVPLLIVFPSDQVPLALCYTLRGQPCLRMLVGKIADGGMTN